MLLVWQHASALQGESGWHPHCLAFGTVDHTCTDHMYVAVLLHYLGCLLLLHSSYMPQVNASPSLSATTQSDRLLKCKVIHDTLQLVTPPDWDPAAPINSTPNGQPSRWDTLSYYLTHREQQRLHTVLFACSAWETNQINVILQLSRQTGFLVAVGSVTV